MKHAACLIRQSPHYRRDAFVKGLSRHYYEVSDKPKAAPSPDDVLVIWNRYGRYHDEACRYERAGAKVLVVENGYIGHDKQGHQLYAIAHNHHLGAGTWYVGDYPRWKEQHIPCEPWRDYGSEVVILPQRGIGEPGVAMPANWTNDILQRVRVATNLPVRVREHPGVNDCVPLMRDLKDARCVVTWASGAAIKALAAGIPVYAEFDRWIAAGASNNDLNAVVKPVWRPDREPIFNRIGWAQWSIDEIERGEPFEYLLKGRTI